LIRRARSVESEAWNSRERSVARVEIGVEAMGFFLLTLSWITGFIFLLTVSADGATVTWAQVSSPSALPGHVNDVGVV
jgi:hypothetical protein